MNFKQIFNFIVPFLVCTCGCVGQDSPQNIKSMAEQDWKNKLTEEQYQILRQKGTERAFTGIYYDHHEQGTYTCAGCRNPLFSSSHKFESGSGWPSFWEVLNSEAVVHKRDDSHGMIRVEAVCAECGGHLGHVFEDGPKPTGLRYCINSAALNFQK